MESTIAHTSLLGLFLPLVLLYFNKGYRTANRYLAAFLFFSALYLLENFYFFYGESLTLIAFFTTTHAFIYLIGPFAFFYLRSILKDNNKLSKTDYLHFAIFVISLIGYTPYFFTNWDYKLLIAQNMLGENWDISQFHINKIFVHEVDQVLNVLHTYFYSISLWYLLWYYKKPANRSIIHTKQYKLIHNWLLTFASIFTLIAINFTVAMAGIWLYDEKSLFLEHTGIALLFASLIYIGMNMVILFFPHIMYGLPLDLILKEASRIIKPSQSDDSFIQVGNDLIKESLVMPISKSEPQLFTDEYIVFIEEYLKREVDKKSYLNPVFKLIQISIESGIPAHHLTYFFNDIKKISFSDWRNSLRIIEAKILIRQGENENFTLQSISLRCGFSSQNTFIRAFKNATGTTPSVFSKLYS